MQNSKRKLLVKLLQGGSASVPLQLQKVWVKPLVMVVALPAHATTSNPAPPTTVPPSPRGSQEFRVSASFIVPDNVQSISITVLGASGGGGGGGNSGMFDLGGMGGNGSLGQSLTQSFSVTPGASITISIGAGGNGGSPYLATRRANGGDAGLTGGSTSVSGTGINIMAAGGRGGGGGGGVIGGTQMPWLGGDGGDGNQGGTGGLGFNRTTPDPSRNGQTAMAGFQGTGAENNGGAGAVGDTSNFTRGGAGSSGMGGRVTIAWG